MPLIFPPVASLAALLVAHAWVVFSVILAALPSLIVALTAYPRVDGALKQLLQLLQLLSVLTHCDSPGTLKMPFVLAQQPSVVGSPVTLAPPRGFAWLLILVVIGVVALLGGTGAILATGHGSSGLGKQVVDCTERAISSAATSAMPQVEGILGGTSPNWNQELVMLEGAVGVGVLCDVEAVVARLAHGKLGELAPHDQVELVRGRAFLIEAR